MADPSGVSYNAPSWMKGIGSIWNNFRNTNRQRNQQRGQQLFGDPNAFPTVRDVFGPLNELRKKTVTPTEWEQRNLSLPRAWEGTKNVYNYVSDRFDFGAPPLYDEIISPVKQFDRDVASGVRADIGAKLGRYVRCIQRAIRYCNTFCFPYWKRCYGTSRKRL